MTHPRITLGGVEIVLHAGAPVEAIEPIGGEVLLRLSQGAAVKMQHWSKRAGTISGQGWMPPGLDGLDYSQPLLLLSTQQENIVGAGRTFTLTSTPRADVEPWAQALVGDVWLPVACAHEYGEVTVEEVAGATLYQVSWLPQFSVFARRPTKARSADHEWTISWEEA